MQNLGAAITAAFQSPRPSAVFNRRKLVWPVSRDKNETYRIVFSKKAFKQGLQEQRLGDREFFNARYRARARRKRQEQKDPFKRCSKLIEPFGILMMLAGYLACCCGSIAEWAKTFPLGDLTHWMPWLKMGGIATLLVGVLLQAICNLLYYWNDTGPLEKYLKNEPVPESRTTSEQTVCKKIQKLKGFRRITDYVFYASMLTSLGSLLPFFVGYISDWATQYPIEISSGQRRVAGIVGICGLILSVVAMWISDMIATWLAMHVQKLAQNPRASICI